MKFIKKFIKFESTVSEETDFEISFEEFQENFSRCVEFSNYEVGEISKIFDMKYFKIANDNLWNRTHQYKPEEEQKSITILDISTRHNSRLRVSIFKTNDDWFIVNLNAEGRKFKCDDIYGLKIFLKSYLG